jgi:hypothetical protein
MSEPALRQEKNSLRGRPAWLDPALVLVAVVAMAFFLAWELVFPADSTINLLSAGRPGELSEGPLVAQPDLSTGVEQTPPIYPVRLAEPTGLAIGPDGRLFVVGDKAVCILDPAGGGSEPRLVPLPVRPRCVHVAEDGTIYVASADRVVVLNPSGEIHAGWAPLGPGAQLTSLASSAEDLFAADAARKLVYRYNRRTGTVRNTIGKRPDELTTQAVRSRVYLNVPGFVVPGAYFDLVLAGDGLLRVVDPGRHRIETYDPDGYYEEPLTWGWAGSTPAGFTGRANPSHLALLSDGSFVTAEKDPPRVKVYSSLGEFRYILAGVAKLGPDASNLDLAIDGRDRVYVLDATEKVIRVFSLPANAEE